MIRNFDESTAANQSTEIHSQAKKRKRGSGESDMHRADKFAEQLAEEKRCRILAEDEVQRLRRKLESYKDRM
jgi:hypothetical protein